MQEMTVDLGERAYPIYIGDGLLRERRLLAGAIDARQVMIVTDTTVAPLYLDRVVEVLNGCEVASVVLPAGERHKTLESFNEVMSALLVRRFGRDCCVLALGGGMVGDVAGFGAACYQRGVDFVQLPTTLLAQVDSSVGGKTGVNHALGKNMIGAFHQPRAVIADTATLSTLDGREVRAGLAEVVKYGLIGDADFFSWLEATCDDVLRLEPRAIGEAVVRSCESKAAMVVCDERESGVRSLLNFGHTFGHAIETGVGYGHWLHGEAVALGMLMAADLSCRLGWIAEGVVGRVERLLRRLELPVVLPEGLKPDALRELMAVDKKVKGGRLFLILLRELGRAVKTDRFDEAKLMETLRHFSADA